jgi:putative peptidoglycan lipid II flippase
MSGEHTDQPRLIINQPVRTPASRSMSLAALLMMAGLLLSKLTGQLREILIVPVLGLGVVSDAFIIGFQIPDLFYQLLIGGAIQAAITPTLAAAIERKREREGWRSVSILINLAGIAVLLAVLLGEALAPVLIPLYNPGKAQETVDLAVRVARALFPQVFFMMLAALCIGILNAYRKFASTSFGPSIYNLCVILAMVFLGQASGQGAVRVAAGVMLSACVYFILQFWLARREFRHYTLTFDRQDQGFRRLLGLAIPTLISGSIVQLNTIILTGFANQFAGAATCLRNASTIWQLPYGIFAVAIGNVMLPSLAGLCAVRDDKGSRLLLTRSLRSTLFLIIPSAAFFLAMPGDVVQAVFQWGSRYSNQTVAVTASILRWYCLAMIPQAMVFLINQAFYARRMTRIALYNGIMTLIINSLLCLALTRWTNLGVSSLSLAYALTSCCSVVFLYYLYRRGNPAAAPQRIWPFLIRSAGCAAALLLVVLALSALPIHPQAKVLQLLWLACRVLAGAAAYLAVAVVLKMPEPREVLRKVNRRLLRRRKMP